MILPSNRSAVGFSVACGVFLIGPLSVGAAVAHADLVGLGGGGGGINVLGIDVLGGKANKSGGAASRTTRAVSTAVSTRSVVVRTKPAAAQPESTLTPAVSTASITDVPVVALSAPAVEVMPVASPPAAPAMPVTGPVFVPPRPEAMPVPSTIQPGPSRGFGPAERPSLPARIPDSFRAGYPEYLRSANTGDLIAAALPGVAGIAGFTIVGAYAGYRQAKALQKALLAQGPTSILL